MPITPVDPHSIVRAVELLGRGECIGLPTETVYGLAADGLNPEAVSKIFEIKNRPLFDPLILHLAQNHSVESIAFTTSIAQKLIEAFFPGPLTLLLEKKDIVPDIVSSGLPTVAIRCPSHPVAQAVLRQFGKPLAAPSANRFGRISPTTAQAVQEELGDQLEIILDGGACEMGIESTIVDCTENTPRILRKGAVTVEAIQKICPTIEYGKTEILKAPGLLKQHYAPRKPLYRAIDQLSTFSKLPSSYSYLFWQECSSTPPDQYRILTPKNSTREAAANLFRMMRELDATQSDAIICDIVPLERLGLAIHDRLERASQGQAIWDGEQFQFTKRD